MNRLHDTVADHGQYFDLLPESFSAAEAPPRDWPCATVAPLHYEPGYAYPLLVWLHGPRGDERQLRSLIAKIGLRNFASVAPRGTHQDGNGGFTWSLSERGLAASQHAVRFAVQAARARFNIAPERIFIAGQQLGGTLAVWNALRRPRYFAGAASLNGAFPADRLALSRLNDARHVPLLFTHGRDSQHYSTAIVCRELALFHAAGLSVNLRQYPCGDDLHAQMLPDLNAWVMEVVTGQSRELSEPMTVSPLQN